MPEAGQRLVAIVTACMNADGTPDFALTEVVATQEETENGAHYYLVETELLRRGYEEPFVHFDDQEGPAFLHPAVRQYLELTPVSDEPTIHIHAKEEQCPA